MFYNTARDPCRTRFSLFLYYVHSVLAASLFFPWPALEIFLGSFGLHETFITRQRCFLRRRFDHFKSRYGCVRIKRRKPRAFILRKNEEKGMKQRDVDFAGCLVDCAMPVPLIDVDFALRETNDRIAAELIKSRRYIAAGIINEKSTTA
jgi:hypothetical protein